MAGLVQAGEFLLDLLGETVFQISQKAAVKAAVKTGNIVGDEEFKLLEESRPRLSEQIFRVDKWSLCRG